MKNYVQYHNVSKQGPFAPWPDGRFHIFATKSIKYLIGHRVWLISGYGKQYRLEHVFSVDSIESGDPHFAFGASGCRFTPPIALDSEPWFAGFLSQQLNFKNGVKEIASAHLAKLEAVLQTYEG